MCHWSPEVSWVVLARPSTSQNGCPFWNVLYAVYLSTLLGSYHLTCPVSPLRSTWLGLLFYNNLTLSLVCTVTIDLYNLAVPSWFAESRCSPWWWRPKVSTALGLHHSLLYFSLYFRNCCFSRKSIRAATEGGKCCPCLLFKSLFCVPLALPLQGWACKSIQKQGTQNIQCLIRPWRGQLCVPNTVVLSSVWVSPQTGSTDPSLSASINPSLSASAAYGFVKCVSLQTGSTDPSLSAFGGGGYQPGNRFTPAPN